jgi:hypothetical protein
MVISHVGGWWSQFHALRLEEATRRRLVKAGAESASSSGVGATRALVVKGVAFVARCVEVGSSMGAVPTAVARFPAPRAGLFTVD